MDTKPQPKQKQLRDRFVSKEKDKMGGGGIG